jgi:hypothetical protein
VWIEAAQMLTKPGVSSSDAAHRVAKTAAYRFAGAFDGVGRPAGSTGEAVGGGQLGGERLELLTGRRTRFSLAPFLGLLELLFQLADPALVVSAGGLVDDRLTRAFGREPSLGRL